MAASSAFSSFEAMSNSTRPQLVRLLQLRERRKQIRFGLGPVVCRRRDLRPSISFGGGRSGDRGFENGGGGRSGGGGGGGGDGGF